MWKLLKIIRGLNIIVSWVMEFLTWGYKISSKLSIKWMGFKENYCILCILWIDMTLCTLISWYLSFLIQFCTPQVRTSTTHLTLLEVDMQKLNTFTYLMSVFLPNQVAVWIRVKPLMKSARKEQSDWKSSTKFVFLYVF